MTLVPNLFVIWTDVSQTDMLRWKFIELSRSIKELDQSVKLETDRQTDFE